MIAHEVAGDGEAETGALVAATVRKRLEQLLAHRSGNTGTGIGDFHDRIARVAPCADPHRSAPILAS